MNVLNIKGIEVKTVAVSDSKDSLKKQRQHLSLELQHLEQTYKSGLLRLQEYTLAKKAMDKKISQIDQKQKQFEAKEKAVEEILGASSMLAAQNFGDVSSKISSEPSLEKHHHKYFMKIEKPKPISSQKTEASSKQVPFKDVSKKEVLKTIKKETLDEQKDKKELARSVHLPASSKISSASPSSKISSASVSPPALDSSLCSPYRDIDELAVQEDSNWRFALAILTLFLLILLYVKFTSFGGSTDVLTIDAYLDVTSPYSKDMHAVLIKLMSDYGQSLWVSSHIIGSSTQNILAGTSVICAERQDHGTEYFDYIFSLDTAFTTDQDAIAAASTLGLDSATFSFCLADVAIREQYLASQQEIAALNISYTPTLIINEKRIVGAVGYDVLKAAIDAEMTSLG